MSLSLSKCPSDPRDYARAGYVSGTILNFCSLGWNIRFRREMRRKAPQLVRGASRASILVFDKLVLDQDGFW